MLAYCVSRRPASYLFISKILMPFCAVTLDHSGSLKILLKFIFALCIVSKEF